MGRSALIGRLVVWALAIVAIDGVVIAAHDDGHAPAPPTAQATTTSTTTATAGTASAVTDSTDDTSATDPSANPASTADTTQATAATTVPIPGASDVEVAHLQGDGENAADSVAFNVAGKWELRWHVEPGGNGVAATIVDNATQGTEFVPMQAGDDSAGFDAGCDCTLQLVPDGSAYDVVVVDVDG